MNKYMPIEYSDGSMPTSTDGKSGEYLCVFPSIGLKKCGQYETWLSNLYTLYPHADYYKQHSSTGKRATPGTFAKYPPTRDGPGLINMYTKVYPGSKTYPNDNSTLRIGNFGSALGGLADQKDLEKLHIMIPSKVKSEQQEYLQHMEDYMTTCQLHGVEPTICIYGCSEPIESTKQTVGPTKPKIQFKTKIRPKSSVSVSAQGPPQYKLEFNESQLSTVTLFEVDFVKEAPGQASGLPNVLQYFKDDGTWSRLLDDVKLIKEAEKVQTKIGDIIGNEDVFPPPDQMFNAFRGCEPKVVIIGQDPYHKPGQAHGLSFSVPRGNTVPPSLRNIYKALENDVDVDFVRPKHGCLEYWVDQGIIMLNASLTVERAKPKSHADIWAGFTDRLIQLIGIKYPGLIYVLWGKDAKSKKPLIGNNASVILEFNHPSPGMPNNKFGTECKHFGQINRHLTRLRKTPIDWQLPE